MTPSHPDARKPLARAFGLAALVPLFVLVYVVAMNAIDAPRVEAPFSLQVVWWVCVFGAAAAAFGAGLAGGAVRGVLASVVVWGVLATGIYLLLGPTCPLVSSGPTPGAVRSLPPVRLSEAFGTLCPDTSAARSVGARWTLGIGGVATALALLGGVVARARRATARPGPVPTNA